MKLPTRRFWLLASAIVLSRTSFAVLHSHRPRHHHNIETGAQEIPKVIHHSWKTADVPDRFKAARDSWSEHHPDWEERLWTDDDNRELVRNEFPWMLNVFDGLTYNIQRADASRIFYMYQFGGVYADLDVYFLKNFDKLLANGTIFMAEISEDRAWEHNIPNAWMASAPRHPFWLVCMTLMAMRAVHCEYEGCEAEWATGPVMLRDAVYIYQNLELPQDLTILGPGLIFPVDWHAEFIPECSQGSGDGFNMSKCLQRYPDAYSVSFWAHSWGKRRRLMEVEEPLDISPMKT